MGGVGLGALTCQLERSAHSALRATSGMPPTTERLDFLTSEAIPRLRDSAATLLLHGFGGSRWKAWWPADQHLIQAFLGHTEPIPFTWAYKVGRQPIEYVEAGGRRAIYSRALNGAVPTVYRDLVINLVHDPVPTWPPTSGGESFA